MTVWADWMQRWAKPAASYRTQDWFPVADLREGCLVRKDGAVIGGITLSPLNLVLKSARERRAIILAVYRIVNSLPCSWQILSYYRPLDLEMYLDDLRAQLQHVSARRELLLRSYLDWVVAQHTAGDAMERRYCLFLTRQGEDALTWQAETLPALAQEWNRIRGMHAQVLDDAAWRSVLFGFFHPNRLGEEPVPDGLVATTIVEEEEHARVEDKEERSHGGLVIPQDT